MIIGDDSRGFVVAGDISNMAHCEAHECLLFHAFTGHIVTGIR